MKRSIRRHQQRVAKLRRMRILRVHCGFGALKPWGQLSRSVMNEPGWWRHERTIVPARIDTHRLEHAIVRGRDPDVVIWPDCQRPHPYYW